MLNKTREKFTGVQLEVNGRYCHFVLNLADQGPIDLLGVWFQLISTVKDYEAEVTSVSPLSSLAD